MTRRGRRAVLLVAGIVAALFVGRWLTTAVADVWWGGTVSPHAATFLLRMHLTRGLLDAAGILLASLWFGFHLVIVFRAIGNVQVPRHLANVEFRETLTPRVLLLVTLALGVLLGLVVGSSASELWDRVHLAWQGVSFGVTEPLLGHDLGFYVAQLPLRLALQRAALVLVLVGLAGTLTLYIVIGAVRWIDRRPALNGHARSHLGWLLATLAAVLAWGFSLHPATVVAGLDGAVDAGVVRGASLVAPALVGTGLMVAVLSALWAVRPRHLLALAAWLVLLLAWLGGRVIVPAAFRTPDELLVAGAELETLLGHAYGLGELELRAYAVEGDTVAPAPVALWTDTLAARAAGAADGGVTAARFVATFGDARRPAWLVTRSVRGRFVAHVLADDRVSPLGAPLFYRAADSVAHPFADPWLELDEPVLRPGAARYVIADAAPGIAAGSWLKRATLAWALQAPALLAREAADGRIAWRLDPRERLGAVAPYADWSTPTPHTSDGRLLWLLHGTVTSESFPLVPRVRLGETDVGFARASFVGVVDAETGDTRIFLRPDADPLSRAWAAAADGTVQAWETLERPVRDALGYPGELFRVQAAALARSPWTGAGTVRLTLLDDSTTVAREAWAADTTLVLTASYVHPGQRRVGAVLVASARGDARRVRLLLPDSASTLSSPTVLASQWSRFALFEQLQDSVRAAGGSLTPAPVRYWFGGDRLGAYRSHFGVGAGGRPVLVWLSLALPDRLAAGRDEPEALENLAGTGVPAPFAPPGRAPIDEARRWMHIADSALRRGDLDGFARAWDGLRATLDPAGDSLAE